MMLHYLCYKKLILESKLNDIIDVTWPICSQLFELYHSQDKHTQSFEC